MNDDITIPGYDVTDLTDFNPEDVTSLTVIEVNEIARNQSYAEAIKLHGFDEILEVLGWEDAEAAVRAVYNMDTVTDYYGHAEFRENMTKGVLAMLGDLHVEANTI